MGIMYATREQVSRSLEVLEAAAAGSQIDQKILAASRSAEGFLHRRFYPELRTIQVDWPNRNSSPSWEYYLGDQELISLDTVTSGGTAITADVVLRRGDDLAEPPYSAIQVDLSSNAAFAAGATWQRSLSIRGTFGYSDTATSLAGGALGGDINSSTVTLTINPSSGLLNVGTGSLLLIGSERLQVIARRMASTTYTTTAIATAQQSAKTISSANASQFAIGEVILIDSERMRIDDIAGNNMVVTRAYDGTALAEHPSGSTIYALRSCICMRGVLGSTAASHASADPVYVHEFPPLLTELVVAEATVMLYQQGAAYARTIGSGAGTREAVGLGLDDVRERAFRELGRKNRLGAV